MWILFLFLWIFGLVLLLLVVLGLLRLVVLDLFLWQRWCVVVGVGESRVVTVAPVALIMMACVGGLGEHGMKRCLRLEWGCSEGWSLWWWR